MRKTNAVVLILAVLVNTLTSRRIQAVREKQLDPMWLCGNISAPVQVTELVEVSKDVVSLAVCTRKKLLW